MKTIIYIKTWGCDCGYRQDFEPTQTLYDLNFNNDKTFPLTDVKENECPSCVLKGKRGSLLTQITDSAQKMTHTIMGEEDIETEITEIKDRKQKGKDKIDDPDISTFDKEDVYRIKRQQDIVNAIIDSKKLEDI